MSNRMKRIGVASDLLARVIGRAGGNISTISHVTGARVEIEKLKKGNEKRIVSLK